MQVLLVLKSKEKNSGVLLSTEKSNLNINLLRVISQVLYRLNTLTLPQ